MTPQVKYYNEINNESSIIIPVIIKSQINQLNQNSVQYIKYTLCTLDLQLYNWM